MYVLCIMHDARESDTNIETTEVNADMTGPDTN